MNAQLSKDNGFSRTPSAKADTKRELECAIYPRAKAAGQLRENKSAAQCNVR
jgi:hypothetical protein